MADNGILYIPQEVDTLIKSGALFVINDSAGKDRHPDSDLVLKTWKQYWEMHNEFHYRKFEPITLEQWHDMLCELPPLKWRMLGERYDTFYCSEAYSGLLHGCYVHDVKTGKCWKGRNERTLTDEQLLAVIDEETALHS